MLVALGFSGAWIVNLTALFVPGMTCAACPIAVKTALTRVAGVSKVDVALAKREAHVTFDDARTGIQALTRAAANAGYPSSVRQ